MGSDTFSGMPALPPSAIEHLSPDARAEVEGWWAELSGEEREEFDALWDVRGEDTAYVALVEAGRTTWQEVPVELRGRLLDPADAHDEALWKEQLLEYVNGHPEIRFFMAEGSFHICRAHAAARRVMMSGLIPARFVCPVGDEGCPLERASRCASGRAIALEAGPGWGGAGSATPPAR